MKKWFTLALIAIFVIAMTGTTFAAPTFADVPAKHWAYEAVTKLANSGLIEGYGDGTFRGDKLMNRYEFALITVKAIDRFERADEAQKKIIDKLSAEFASELNRLGARVAKVEKKTNVWFGGETRLRFLSDSPKVAGAKKLSGNDQFDFRQRLIANGTVNDQVSWTARLSTNGNSRFGAPENTANGSEFSLDIMNVSFKDILGIDNLRIGRTALDFWGNGGIMSKPWGLDGVTVKEKFGKTDFLAWTGNAKVETIGTPPVYTDESGQLTTAQFGYKVSKNLNVKAGYYSSDVKASGATGLKVESGSFTSSQGWMTSAHAKLGQLTLLADYQATSLDGAVGLPDSPKAWAVQLSNSQGPPVFFPAVFLVNPTQKGSDAWMVSYKSYGAGSITPGTQSGNTTAHAYTGKWSTFANLDNVNVLYLAYQRTLMKNVVGSIEWQDVKIKDSSIAGGRTDLDKTFQVRFEILY